MLESVLPPVLQAAPALVPLLSGVADPFAALDPTARLALLAEAQGHGLLSRLAGQLPDGDTALRSRFERVAAGLALRDRRAREVLGEVVGLLVDAHVAPIALKGPVLAERFYSSPVLRPSSDLDLLVAREDLPRAIDALVAAGFRRADPLQDAYQLERHHHVQLLRAPGPHVELHFRAVSACGASVPTGELLARAMPHRTTEGLALRVLAPEDEFLTLAVHAAGHAFRRLGWLLDLIYFLARHPALDWRAITSRGASYRCRETLAYTCAVLRELGAPVPAAAAGAPRRRRLADGLAAATLRRPAGKPRMAFHTAYQLALRDRLGEIPREMLAELGWVVRRRAVRLRRRLRGPDAAAGPAGEAAPAFRSLPEPFWQPVRGRSMLPTLREGDEVLLDKADALAPGDVVVLRHPTRGGTLLHRIVELGEGRVLTQGDGCRAPDPAVGPAQILFRAVALRRGGRTLTIPPRPPSPLARWLRLAGRRR